MNIRNIAICLIHRGDDLFVGQGFDSVKKETFYRPLGGGIDFGEFASHAAVREFQEEMDVDIEIVRFETTFENIFTCNGKAGHEIVFLFTAKFKDSSIYQAEQFICSEGEYQFIAKWVHKNEFISGEKILYPTGLTEYLLKQINGCAVADAKLEREDFEQPMQNLLIST